MTRGKIIGVAGPKNTPIGEDHHNAKLTDAQVETIRDLYDQGFGYRAIARKLDLKRSTVRDICTFRRRGCTPDGYRVRQADTAVKPPPTFFAGAKNRMLAEERETMREFAREGMTAKQISEVTGYCYNTVRKALLEKTETDFIIDEVFDDMLG